MLGWQAVRVDFLYKALDMADWCLVFLLPLYRLFIPEGSNHIYQIFLHVGCHMWIRLCQLHARVQSFQGRSEVDVTCLLMFGFKYKRQPGEGAIISVLVSGH